MVDPVLVEQVASLTAGEQVEFTRTVRDSCDHARVSVTSGEKLMVDDALADLAANPEGVISATESVTRLRQLVRPKLDVCVPACHSL